MTMAYPFQFSLIWGAEASRSDKKIFLLQTFVARHPGAGKFGEHDGARRSEGVSDSRL